MTVGIVHVGVEQTQDLDGQEGQRMDGTNE